MSSTYQKGFQNASRLGDLFAQDEIVAGTTAVAATSVAATLSLAFTPDFVLFSSRDDSSGTFTVTISGTTTGLVTFTRATSTAATTIDYIAGDLA